MRKRKQMISTVVLVMVLTGAVFLPSLSNGFVNYDDDTDLVENDKVKSLTLENIKRMFIEEHSGYYCPLVPLSYAVEYHFFGDNPFVYHLTNYFLHLLCTLLVFLFIYMLTGRIFPAFVVSTIFGVHTLHVESVAWITERKDLMYSLFYLAALVLYLFYLRKDGKRYYWACMVAAILSFFSKPMAVTLPGALLLLDYYHGRKLELKILYEKIPLLCMAGVVTLVAVHFLRIAGATGLEADLGVRAYFFTKQWWFYLSKFIAPINLSAIYPYYDIGPSRIAEIKYYVLFVAAALFLVVGSLKYTKKIMFGFGFFAITILPVIKIIPNGDFFAADRYLYIPSIGLLYILAVVLDYIVGGKSKFIRIICPIVLFSCVVWVGILSVLTWQRCLVWKNSETLFNNVLIQYKESPLPYNNIGVFYAEKGDLDTAVGYFKKALEVEPEHELSLENLVLARKKMRKSPGKDPVVITAKVRKLNSMGVKSGKEGDINAAIAFFEEAERLDSGDTETYNNLGYAYGMKGDTEKAVDYFRKALELDPDNAKARNNIDFLTEQKNRERII